MCILPIMEQKVTGAALIPLFPVDLRHAANQNKGEIIVLMEMPGHLLLGIVRVRQRNSIQMNGFGRNPIKLTGF